MWIKKKHIFIHNQFFKSKHKTKITNIDYLTWGPNVGVILVRNTKWSLEFFKNVWNKKKYLDHFWPDNAAFMDELGFIPEGDYNQIFTLSVVWYENDGEVMVHQIYDHDSGDILWEDKTNDEWTDNDEQLLDSLLMYGNLQETIGELYV